MCCTRAYAPIRGGWRLALMLLAAAAAVRAAGAQEPTVSPSVRRVLTAMLGAPESARIRTRDLALTSFPRVRFAVGELDGPHDPAEVLVALLPDAAPLPLGCAQSRRVLQLLQAPEAWEENLGRYAFELAILDGAVSPLATLVSSLGSLPEWARAAAVQAGVAVQPPTTSVVPGGYRSVRFFAWSQGLVEVRVLIGHTRLQDAVSHTSVIARVSN